MTVQRKQQVTSLAQPQTIKPQRLQKPMPVVTDSINKHITHYNCRIGQSFSIQIRIGADAGCKKHIGNSIYDSTVHFARFAKIKAAGSCNDMRHLESPFLGHNRTSHGSRTVIYYQYKIGRISIKLTFESQHDLACYL